MGPGETFDGRILPVDTKFNSLAVLIVHVSNGEGRNESNFDNKRFPDDAARIFVHTSVGSERKR